MKNVVTRKVFNPHTGEIETQARVFKSEEEAKRFIKSNVLEMGVIHVKENN